MSSTSQTCDLTVMALRLQEFAGGNAAGERGAAIAARHTEHQPVVGGVIAGKPGEARAGDAWLRLRNDGRRLHGHGVVSIMAGFVSTGSAYPASARPEKLLAMNTYGVLRVGVQRPRHGEQPYHFGALMPLSYATVGATRDKPETARPYRPAIAFAEQSLGHVAVAGND